MDKKGFEFFQKLSYAVFCLGRPSDVLYKRIAENRAKILIDVPSWNYLEHDELLQTLEQNGLKVTYWFTSRSDKGILMSVDVEDAEVNENE